MTSQAEQPKGLSSSWLGGRSCLFHRALRPASAPMEGANARLLRGLVRHELRAKQSLKCTLSLETSHLHSG